jgi:hypothetical protein
MEQLLKLGSRNGKVIVLVAILVAIGLAFAHISSLNSEQQEELLYLAQDYLPIFMFLTLAVLLFSGFPVAFILGGLALLYGLIGYVMGSFSLIEFFNFLPRIWGQAAENLVLVAVPAFVFMGVMMERSGVANDLLYCVQVLLKRVPGALALAVTIMGTILAAMTGIIGASVTMMTALALPTMMRQGYSHALACGTIAASGTRKRIHGGDRPRAHPRRALSHVRMADCVAEARGGTAIGGEFAQRPTTRTDTRIQMGQGFADRRSLDPGHGAGLVVRCRLRHQRRLQISPDAAGVSGLCGVARRAVHLSLRGTTAA